MSNFPALIPKLSPAAVARRDFALALKAEAARRNTRPPSYGAGWGMYLSGAGISAVNGERNYSAEIGRIDLNPIVRLCLGWYANAVTQAFFRVGKRIKRGARKGEYAINETHDLNAIFDRPCPIFSARETWAKIIAGYLIDGNAYLVIVRDNGGQPRELWWVPNWQVTVIASREPRRPIDRYEVASSTGESIRYSPENIVHIRDLPDDRNPLLGMGRLKSFLAYVASLQHGGDYTDSAMRTGNTGVVAMPPENDPGNWSVTDDSEGLGYVARLERMAARAKAGVSRFGFINRFMHLEKIGLSPEEMTLDRILDRPESYICAAMGLSPLLFDLPSSSESRTYSNKGEARRGAWEDSLVPMLGTIAEAIWGQVLYQIDPDDGELVGQFGDAPGLEVWADTSEVPALREDQAEKAELWISLKDAGLCTKQYAASQLDIPEEAVPEDEPEPADFAPGGGDDDPDAFDPERDDPAAFDFKAELQAFDDAEALLDSLGLTWDELEGLTDEEVDALGLTEDELALLGLQYEEDEPEAPVARNGKPVKALAGDCQCGGGEP